MDVFTGCFYSVVNFNKVSTEFMLGTKQLKVLCKDRMAAILTERCNIIPLEAKQTLPKEV